MPRKANTKQPRKAATLSPRAASKPASEIIPISAQNIRRFQFLEKYVEAIANGKWHFGLARDIVAKVYPEIKSPEARSVSASRILKALGKNQHVHKALHAAGVDVVRVGVTLGNILEAQRPYIANGEVYQTPDNSARVAAVRLAAQLLGILTQQDTSIGNQINVVILPATGPVDFSKVKPIIPAGAVAVTAKNAQAIYGKGAGNE